MSFVEARNAAGSTRKMVGWYDYIPLLRSVAATYAHALLGRLILSRSERSKQVSSKQPVPMQLSLVT